MDLSSVDDSTKAISIVQGDSYSVTFWCSEPTNPPTPMNMTGWNWRLVASKSLDSPHALSLMLGAGIEIGEPTETATPLTVTFSIAATKKMTGEYFYQLERFDGGTVNITEINSTLTIFQEVK